MPQPQWMEAPAAPQAPAPVGWSQTASVSGDITDAAGLSTGAATPVAIYRNVSGKLERQYITPTQAFALGITLDPATISGGVGLIQISQ